MRSSPRSPDRTQATYRRLWSKAAALTHSLVTNHGFTDGNKRTALLAVHLLVERSGWTFVRGTEHEIDHMLVAVANRELTFDQIESWYRARLRRARITHRGARA
jgi:death-on-curing protein